TEAEADRAIATNAERERAAAEQLARQKEYAGQRDSGQLQRTEDRIKKSEADMAVARAAIPQKDAAAKEAKAAAEGLRDKAIADDPKRAAAQDPHEVARRIDAFIDARLASQKIAASPQIDDAEFLRRVTLDITGAIPKYDDVLAFLAESPGG